MESNVERIYVKLWPRLIPGFFALLFIGIAITQDFDYILLSLAVLLAGITILLLKLKLNYFYLRGDCLEIYLYRFSTAKIPVAHLDSIVTGEEYLDASDGITFSRQIKVSLKPGFYEERLKAAPYVENIKRHEDGSIREFHYITTCSTVMYTPPKQT